LQNGNYRSQIIVSELQTEPADKLHQIIFQTGPSLFPSVQSKELGEARPYQSKHR
jgi:hypothetical protein